MQEVKPDEAKRLVAEEDYIYLDVRTAEEFRLGHPEGAVCVPAFLRGPGGYVPNPDFPAVVSKYTPMDAKVVVGCAAGGRSAKAIQLLAQHGYDKLINVACGFKGSQTGPGWEALGLPVETGGEPLG